MDALLEFLQRERARKWSWAETNCALWVADWIKVRCGVDPAHGLRGKASTAEEWKALLSREGGFVPIIGEAMDRCGFERTQAATRGDVAIVSAPIAYSNRMPVVGAIAGIVLDGAIARNIWPLSVTRALRGLHFERLPMITAWRIN